MFAVTSSIARSATTERPVARVVLTVHARERFAERISAALDPEVGLRALVTEALATQGQMVLRAGALARRHRVRDIEVVLSADCRTVITVYRDGEVPRRRRWRMPEVAAAGVGRAALGSRCDQRTFRPGGLVPRPVR